MVQIHEHDNYPLFLEGFHTGIYNIVTSTKYWQMRYMHNQVSGLLSLEEEQAFR